MKIMLLKFTKSLLKSKTLASGNFPSPAGKMFWSGWYLLYEPRDLWVGVYWKGSKYSAFQASRVEIYVCFIPTLPIKILLNWVPKGFSNLDKHL